MLTQRDDAPATPISVRSPDSARGLRPTDPATAPFAETAVLDEVGIGLFILDAGGEVLASNAVAEGLLRRRTGRTTLLGELVERVRAGEAPRGHGAQTGSAGRTSLVDPAGAEPGALTSGWVETGARAWGAIEDPMMDSKREWVEVEGEGGKRSIVGYRFVRSPRLGTIFTLRDITELERSRGEREALERLSQVGRACAMVAHEIGNPIAAIKATLQSVEREAAAAGLGDTLGAVFREVDRLDTILSQLLGFVRHRPPRRMRTELGAILARARGAAGARLTGIAFLGLWGPVPEVLCDPDQLEQVFLNLFLNAADAMRGHGELLVRARAAGDMMVILVEDSGPGVPPDQREKVFESFYTTKQAGVGLGLSVCFRIMSDHGGSISIEDREGARGASVRLTLPLARSG